jgi:Holliday junction resolvase RusA-like endonuclease
MKIYLAARYSRIGEMNQVAAVLRTLGHVITSRWINGGHCMPDCAVGTPDEVAIRQRFAAEDLDDLRAAGCLISFTEEPRCATRGGRHVEFGVAIGTRPAVHRRRPARARLPLAARGRVVPGPTGDGDRRGRSSVIVLKNLPLPCPLNALYRARAVRLRDGRVVQKMGVSRRARIRRDELLIAIWRQCGGRPVPMRCAVQISFTITPRDGRTPDCDAYHKHLLDCLAHASVIADDKQVMQISAERLPAKFPGHIDVQISEVPT